MDEVLFRGSQKLEEMQMHADLVASKTKDMVQTYSEATQAILHQIWQSERLDLFKQNVSHLVDYLMKISKDFKNRTFEIADPERLWLFLTSILGGRWSRRDMGIACAGLVIGSLIGALIGLALKQTKPPIRYMEAVQISHYLGPEGATVVENAVAPHKCGDYDVLVNVRAASVHIIDAQICSGYGKTLRRILRRLHKESCSDLPVNLGRDCTGVVTDLGKKVTRLDVGDEVWVTVPFWSQGTLCQTFLVSENRVARKPKNVGFEGASSIPYAGSLALSILTEAEMDFDSVRHKRFLIQEGCTPVGCVLIQLLNSWKAHITTTCNKRAVPVAKALGAHDIISIDDSQFTDNASGEPREKVETTLLSKALFKELEARGEQFDVIVVTRDENLDWNNLNTFCVTGGLILSTIPDTLLSDSCGFFSRLLLAGYIRLTFLIQNTLGWPTNNYDEAHICSATLDRLTELVEEGVLQTVVDKVYHPKDIEIALNYIQSPQSIGSSVISFR